MPGTGWVVGMPAAPRTTVGCGTAWIRCTCSSHNVQAASRLVPPTALVTTQLLTRIATRSILPRAAVNTEAASPSGPGRLETGV